ncbi:MAG: PTS sugar transporter subunit IIA [Eubacteriaceae bacterium]|jgi:mannitol/fructose-specific phosphotransferase system IIA component (Ntr-type)
MNMQDMLKPEYVYTNVEFEEPTKDAAIKAIAKTIADGDQSVQDELEKTFFAREAMDSTGCGAGVAIPHAKIKGLQEPKVEIFKFKDKIDWDAIDDEPVMMAVALVMPDGDKDNLHLQVISKFARKLVDDDFVAALEKENDPQKLYQFIIDELA